MFELWAAPVSSRGPSKKIEGKTHFHMTGERPDERGDQIPPPGAYPCLRLSRNMATIGNVEWAPAPIDQFHTHRSRVTVGFPLFFLPPRRYLYRHIEAWRGSGSLRISFMCTSASAMRAA